MITGVSETEFVEHGARMTTAVTVEFAENQRPLCPDMR
jgi:hypothetical protein